MRSQKHPGEIDVAAGLSDGDLVDAAAVLADAFADYPVAISFTPESVRRMCDAEDVLLDACGLARDGDGRMLGVGFAALRGDRGRLAAMGVIREAHHRGIGRAVATVVLDRLRRAGARQVVLEALTVNASALSLYEQLGFVRQRRLIGFVRSAGGLPIPGSRWESAIAGRGEPDSWQLARVVHAARAQADLTMVPAVIPERHPVADLLREAGYLEAEIDQYELSLSWPATGTGESYLILKPPAH